MTCAQRSPTLVEDLPTEIFFQIFGFLKLQELNTAFSDLNSRMNLIIRSTNNISLSIKVNNTNGLELLHLYSDQINHLSIIDSADVTNLPLLPKLRSLALICKNYSQWHLVRPEKMPSLKTLCIENINQGASIVRDDRINLLDTIFSNGFPQLQKCVLYNIGNVTFNNAWTGSDSLRILKMCIEETADIERLLKICPQLKQSAYNFNLTIRPYPIISRRILKEIEKLRNLNLEEERRFTIENDFWGIVEHRQIPPRFNKTIATENHRRANVPYIQCRIFPQTKPYCQASFLIELELGDNYPFRAPKILVLDPMYHPVVHGIRTNFCWYGCSDHDSFDFKPTTSIVEVLEAVIKRIDNVSDIICIADEECAKEYKDNYDKFYEKALDMTLSYGRPRC